MTRHKSPLRQAQHAATAEAMLDAAERAMIRRGYERVTMQQIARETGCAAGTFYLYFKNKQVLFQAIVVRHMREMHAAARTAMAAVGDPLGKIRESVTAILRYWQDRSSSVRLTLTVWPMRHRAVREQLGVAGRKEHEEFQQTLMGHLRQAQRQGRIRRDLPAETLIDFLEAVGFSLMEAFSLSQGRQAVEEQARVFWGLMAGGIVHQE